MKINYKPILFSTEMIQADLGNRKTQTRRVCKISPEANIMGLYTKRRLWDSSMEENPNPIAHIAKFNWGEVKSKYKIGDILWVRETFEKVAIEKSSVDGNESDIIFKYQYKSDKYESFEKWKPSIHMPKEAARIFLKVTNVRCERLQDISEEDAIAEGVEGSKKDGFKNYVGIGSVCAEVSFETLWDSINAKKISMEI